MARDAPLAVVLRRGPSRSICSLLWDRRSDRLQVGQWFRGRIYERRSDLSPDGRYMIYFAAKHSAAASESRGTWTAVSRAPYLEALVMLPKGDCWNGGGLFTANDRYWLNGCGHTVLRDSREVRIDERSRPQGGVGGEDLSVYFPRLLRDGWRRATPVSEGPRGHSGRVVFEKGAGAGWVLRKITHAGVHRAQGRACYWDEHEIENAGSGAVLGFPEWEWAEVDRDRLVWAAGGCLCAARLTEGGLCEEKVIADMSGMRFERIRAPYSRA